VVLSWPQFALYFSLVAIAYDQQVVDIVQPIMEIMPGKSNR
jgi:hypothetical protein